MFDSLAEDDQDRIRTDLRIALTGSGVAAVLMGTVSILIGDVGNERSDDLLRAALPTLRAFASTVLIVTSSALALMLTILGLTTDANQEVRGGHYERVRQIALAAVAVFVAAAFLFMVLVIPPSEMGAVATRWYDVIYYAVSGLTALIGGSMVGIVLMIYSAVEDIAATFGPGDETPILADGASEDDLGDGGGA